MKEGFSGVALVSLLLLVAAGTGLAQWNGEIVGWGNNDEGQYDFPENFGYVAIAAGGYCVLEDPPDFPPLSWANHSLGLKEDGSIVAVGNNGLGQCDVPEPNEGFVAVAAGNFHSLGLKEDGSIVGWGSNWWGECDVPEPNEGFVAIAAGGGFIDGGYSHSLGLKEDGSIVAWGDNSMGQCDVPEPNEGFVAVAVGSFHSLGLKEDGSIVAWGDNSMGQCDVPEPNTGFVAIAAGIGHSLGLREISTGVEGAGPNANFIRIASIAPNPFPATTTITIALPAPGPVQLDVFDLAGRRVNTLVNQTLPAGNQTAVFDGSELPPGVYLVRLTSGSECATAKVVLVR